MKRLYIREPRRKRFARKFHAFKVKAIKDTAYFTFSGLIFYGLATSTILPAIEQIRADVKQKTAVITQYLIPQSSASITEIQGSQIISPIAPPEKKEIVIQTTPIDPTPTPSELESIVAYIARVFEPEGKDVVVQAINCFYSESGLRPDAVGHNNDSVRSTDWGVAQLNSYWHNLTTEEKTEVKANIDRAYAIYKGRGNNFSAWYGKRCN